MAVINMAEKIPRTFKINVLIDLTSKQKALLIHIIGFKQPELTGTLYRGSLLFMTSLFVF